MRPRSLLLFASVLLGAVAAVSPAPATAAEVKLEVNESGAGGRLEIDLIANSASLATVRHKKKSTSTVVGRLVRTSLNAGKVSFSVSLNAKAKSALRRHHRLALTVKIMLTPQHGTAGTVTRGVVVHA